MLLFLLNFSPSSLVKHTLFLQRITLQYWLNQFHMSLSSNVCLYGRKNVFKKKPTCYFVVFLNFLNLTFLKEIGSGIDWLKKKL